MNDVMLNKDSNEVLLHPKVQKEFKERDKEINKKDMVLNHYMKIINELEARNKKQADDIMKLKEENIKIVFELNSLTAENQSLKEKE